MLCAVTRNTARDPQTLVYENYGCIQAYNAVAVQNHVRRAYTLYRKIHNPSISHFRPTRQVLHCVLPRPKI